MNRNKKLFSFTEGFNPALNIIVSVQEVFADFQFGKMAEILVNCTQYPTKELSPLLTLYVQEVLTHLYSTYYSFESLFAIIFFLDGFIR